MQKSSVRSYWQEQPCGSSDAGRHVEGSPDYFQAVEGVRYKGDDFMLKVCGFNNWQGKRVLEVGCGLGTDLVQFARGGAHVSAIDLTQRGAMMARKNLARAGCKGETLCADSESLPFANNSFDLVYSWGVIHHTPDTEQAAREIMRVCRPGGSVLVMLYNRRSLLSLQAWLMYGLCRGRPFRSVSDILAHHLESPGTKAYTRAEAAQLFSGLQSVTVKPIVTRYDLRLGRRLFLPRFTRRLVPATLGWFLVVRGVKS